MDDISFIDERFKEIIETLNTPHIKNKLIEAKKLVMIVRKNNKKIIFAGNGASTTIASHGALDFMNQLNVKCYCFNDPNMITAYSNDFGYENSISRYIKLIAEKDDLLFLISSSGESKNVCKCAISAINKECKVITFTGFKSNNSLSQLGTLNLWLNNKDYNVVECVHNIWLVSICDMIVKDEKNKIGIHGRIL